MPPTAFHCINPAGHPPRILYSRNRLLNLAVSLMRHRANRASTLYYRGVAKSHAGILGNAARRDASPHHAAVTVDDLQRAIEEVKRTVRKAKREIIEDAHTARASEADRRRVPTGERSNQIAAVRKLVREARASGKKLSILRACRAVWRDVNGGIRHPRRFTTTATATSRSSRARASPRDRAMHCCRSLELVEPLWRVAEIDEAIYSKMDIVRASGGKRPPVTGHFI